MTYPNEKIYEAINVPKNKNKLEELRKFFTLW